MPCKKTFLAQLYSYFNQPKKLPESGPMAEMLKKMFGPKSD